MTLKLSESWAAYGSNSDITTYAANWWEAVGSPWTWGATNGPRSEPGMQAATTGGGALVLGRNLHGGLANNNADPMGICFEVKISAAPASLVSFIKVYANGSASVDAYRLNTSGQLTFYETGGGILGTGPTNICDGNRHWINIVFTVGNSTGIQKCWIDGVMQWNSPGNLGNVGANEVAFISLASRTVNLGDFYMFNTGGSVYNDTSMPIGDRQIITKFPDGDASVQFSHSTGSTNFGVIDEQPLSLTDYTESVTTGQKDYLDYAALGSSPASVYSVQTKTLLGNNAPGIVSMRANAKSSGATVTNGTTLVCPGTPRFIMETFLTEPGGAAWTETKVDGAQFGYEFIS